MDTYYPVNLNGKPAGKTTVRRQGLYYIFFCRCQITGNTIYRLIVSDGKNKENLGILVPQEGSFMLTAKLPVKRLGKGELSFYLQPKQSEVNEFFIPISPEEPFTYIARLKESFLTQRNQQMGICIPDM